MALRLTGGYVFRDGTMKRADISLSGGGSVPSDRTISIEECCIFPGFADVHVHFREPGFLYKETIATGTAAAARGGYTDVCTMPNLDPAPDDLPHLNVQLDAIRTDARVRVHPYGTITRAEKGRTLSDMAALAPYVVAFSDDGKGVQDAGCMRDAMAAARALDRMIVAHCEDESLLRGGKIHDGAYARAHGITDGISSASEWRQLERDLKLVRDTGCRYHLCHMSTKESVQLIRDAKKSGLDVSCETAPHYVLLDDRDLQDDGHFVMNPPLRDRTDRDALLEAAFDGTIDMIATDHAPHSAAEKGGGLADSRMGVVGLETAFPLLYTDLVRGKGMPLARLIELMSTAPRARFRLPHDPMADACVFDLHHTTVIDPNHFLSKGRSTPFAGATVYGICQVTVVGGAVAYECEYRGGHFDA